MSLNKRVAGALMALVLFLLGLAGIWRFANQGKVVDQLPAPPNSPSSEKVSPPVVGPDRPAAPRVTTPPTAEPVQVANQSAVGMALPRPITPANVGATPAPSPAAITASADEIGAVKIALDKVGLMFRDYRTRMGGNPEGTNAEIMRAVMGGNPKGAQLGPPEGQSLNARGELVDRWGTAYFFHQMSAAHMEIHSAGPDKVFGTEDDVVQR